MSRNRSIRSRRPTYRSRRGAVYVLVLMTSMIVMLIALAAISLSSIERRRSRSAADANAARAAARAAIEFGFLKIRSETSWANLGSSNPNWASAVPFDNGTFSLRRVGYVNTDPLNDRLTLLALGTHGDAVCQFQVVIVRGAWVEQSGWTQTVN